MPRVDATVAGRPLAGADPDPEPSGALTGTPGDHENTLTWDAVSGATSYRLTRFDPAWTASGATATIYTGTATSYLDSPAPMSATRGTAATAVRSSKGLVLGEAYMYTLYATVGGVESQVATVTCRPDDGISLTNWSAVNGSTRRDARNTGHFAIGGSYTTSGAATLSPGSYSDRIFTGTVTVSSGTYTFSNCWFQGEVWQSDLQSGNVATITYNDCTIGPGRGHGSNSSVYDKNGMIPPGKWTLNRCRVMHGGSQAFCHYGGPNAVNDSFFHDMCAPDYVVDPHCDCIWVSTGGASSHALTVSRCHFEAAGRGTSSVIGPDTSTSLTVQDCLFNSGSAHGSVVYGTGATIRRNRFKRYNAGGTGFVDMTDGNTVSNTGGSFGTALVVSDNRWTDDNSLAFGSA